MKILWHSNSPFMKSGYGIQTALNVPLLRDLGHEVAISSFGGGSYGHITEFEGIPVLPSGEMNYGNDVLQEHYRRSGAELLITLMDPWALDPSNLGGMRVMPWMPCDTAPMSFLEKWWIGQATAAGAQIHPVAMSRHGQAVMAAEGFQAPYVPHTVDLSAFRPGAARREWRRQEFGLPPEVFLIVINANNKGVPSRKALEEQLQAFALFAAGHKKAALYVHARTVTPDGLALPAIVEALGLAGRVQFADSYRYSTGGYDAAWMAAMYCAADVVSNCSMAEGFGIPILESQACGTPVIATRASAMTELVPKDAGWLVNGDRFWVHSHNSWWIRPSVREIAEAYNRAFVSARSETRRAAARRNAGQYDAATAGEQYWKPALDSLL